MVVLVSLGFGLRVCWVVCGRDLLRAAFLFAGVGLVLCLVWVGLVWVDFVDCSFSVGSGVCAVLLVLTMPVCFCVSLGVWCVGLVPLTFAGCVCWLLDCLWWVLWVAS